MILHNDPFGPAIAASASARAAHAEHVGACLLAHLRRCSICLRSDRCMCMNHVQVAWLNRMFLQAVLGRPVFGTRQSLQCCSPRLHTTKNTLDRSFSGSAVSKKGDWVAGHEWVQVFRTGCCRRHPGVRHKSAPPGSLASIHHLTCNAHT